MTLPVIFPPVMTASVPKAKAVVFDGTNDYLTRAAFSSISAGPYGTVSVWLKMNGGDAASQILLTILQAGYTGLSVTRNSANRFSVSGRTTGNVEIVSLSGATSITTSSGWVHCLSSWSTGVTGYIYVNDVSDESTPTTSSGDVGYAATSVAVGALNTGANKANCDMADLWFDTTYFDLSDSTNRRKFIRSNGKPAFLGSSGQRPTGSAPVLYLKGPASAFATNNGSGGSFSVNGALADASTSPSD